MFVGLNDGVTMETYHQSNVDRGLGNSSTDVQGSTLRSDTSPKGDRCNMRITDVLDGAKPEVQYRLKACSIDSH